MTTLKYIFGSNCVSLDKILGLYRYQSYSIRHLTFKVIGLTPNKRLRAYCKVEVGNKIIHGPCSYTIDIDTYTGTNFNFRGLTTHQGYLTNRRKKIIREGSLGFRRITLVCPKYLPRSVSVFIPNGKLSSFSCVLNIRVILTDYEDDGIHMINLHCLDSPRVIRQSQNGSRVN